jgi:nicotinamide/nicotinate riboside kinase
VLTALDATDAAAGSIWTDPPNYFDNIVYPAYLKAHEALFVDQNVEDGKLAPNAVERGIQVFTPAEGSEGMERVVDAACDAILQALRIGGGVVIKEE